MLYTVAKSVYILVFAIAAVVNTTRQFQMLQQNSYFTSRYRGWLREQKFSVFGAFGVFFSALAGMFIFCRDFIYKMIFSFVSRTQLSSYIVIGIYALLLIVSGIMGYCAAYKSVDDNINSVKPLVVTSRVKRMYVAASVIVLLFAVPSAILKSFTAFGLFVAVSVLLFFPMITALLVSLVTKPFEKLIGNHFVNDAKKILKDSPNLTVIGITGSYGKTGTKFIIKRILDEKFNVVATPGSFNTTLGVVRTIRENLRPQTEVFLCEMGAKNRGDIKEICDLVNPQIGVITSVGPQHLETFGTIENVADTKFELADSANEVFLNFDNEIIKDRADKYNHIGYGTNKDADVRAEDISYGSFGATFNVICDNEKIPITTSLLGKHNVLNITAGVAVAKRLGLNNEQISYAVTRLKPTEHRLELKSFINGSLLIDDAYNANPDGSEEAVNVLGSFDGKKKIIVTPGLVELGEKEYEYNKALGAHTAKKCDIIILVGEKRSVPLKEGALSNNFPEDKLFVVESFAKAMELLRTLVSDDTVTLFENDLPDNYLK